MISIIYENRTVIAKICNKYKVRELYLFGSATSNAYDPENSDIDFAVLFGSDIPVEDMADHYFGVIEELEGLLGKPIDLITLQSIKNPIFKEELNKTMIPLYAA